MRNRGENDAAVKTVAADTLSATTTRQRKKPHQPLIPTQKLPTHDGVEVEEAVSETVAEPAVEPEVDATEEAPAQELAPQVAPVVSSASVPARAQWRASHGPRVFAAALLLFAVAGTSALGLRYAETHGPDEFISVIIGIGVVVALWALLIASTPQVVSLRGSVLTVRNSSGSERFDLADGLQPVDVVGQPHSSQWALLLHRSNNTSVVLRRRDVDAVALDPIVRHYRAMADQRYSDRQVRFSR